MRALPPALARRCIAVLLGVPPRRVAVVNGPACVVMGNESLVRRIREAFLRSTLGGLAWKLAMNLLRLLMMICSQRVVFRT
jgi:hypothetical protein